MAAEASSAALESALVSREGALARAAARWGLLAHGAALAFVAALYSNPMYWWPWFEKLRLGFASMAVGAAAVIAHRLASGERIRLGGPGALLLLAYGAFIPFSALWTIAPESTSAEVLEAGKMLVVFLTVQNGLDTPRRLRRFLLVAATASLGPALGGLWVWRNGEDLVEGFRTHWRGLYTDPNRLAMSLVAVLPFSVLGFFAARRRAHRIFFALVVAAQVAAIVLTHSRSGAVAAAVAALLVLFRGRSSAARGLLLGCLLAAGVALLAPSSFWERQASIAQYREDASVEGRRHAWMVLGNILADRPLGGVGAGAFLPAWDRYAPLEAGGHRFVAHNVLLEIMGELGVPAFLLFAVWCGWLVAAVWRAGADPLVGGEARAILAALAGYLVCEMVNGYSLSWFLYFLFGCGAAVVRLARLRATAAEARAP
jgi:O-antigen ligase